MEDKQKSEEEMYNELESMYQRVADLERDETAPEQGSHPDEYKEVADQAVPIYEQTVSFPEDRIRGTHEDLLKEIPKPKKKRSYRLVAIAASFSFIILIIAAIIIVKTVINPQSSGTGTIHQPIATAPLTTKKLPPESPPVQMEQGAMKGTQQGVEASKPIFQGIMKSEKPLTPDRYWAIQVGAFHNLEYLHDLMEELKKDGLDAYWVSKGSNKQKPLYIVFVGHFTDAKEAAEFLKDKTILTHYPDSFVQEILSPEINH